MRGKIRILVSALLLICTLSVGALGVNASGKSGWVSEDGVFRYYENGTAVTGEKKIGAHTYIFDENGIYVGVADGHDPIGKEDTMLTNEYINALNERKVLAYMSFNKDQCAYGNSSSGAFNNSVTLGTKITGTKYIKQIGSTNGSSHRLVATGGASFISVRNGDDYAYTIKDYAEGEAYVDTYLSKSDDVNPIGESLVYEAEYKLSEDFAPETNMVFLYFLYRQNGKLSVINGILTLTTDGYIYASSYSSKEYLCKLVSDEYTRISVAVDPKGNTFDFYVNGILVKAGIPFSPKSDLSKERITEIRTACFSGNGKDEGSINIDNIAVYSGDKPVCVDTETPVRNGAYEEGSYLRFYKNNIIQTGNARVNGTYFGQEFNNESISFNEGRAFAGNRATIKNGDKTLSSTVVDGNLFTAPAAVGMGNKAFVAWKTTDSAGKVSIMSPGDVNMLESNVTLEAVGIELAMLDGASVKFSSDTSLRFVAKVSKEDYSKLASLGLSAEMHILIAPTSYYDGLYGYHTLEALSEADLDKSRIFDVKAEGWFKETDGYYYFTASTPTIAKADYTENYSAIAYTVIKGGTGEEKIIYSDYSDENNSRSVYEVASKAYNDRVTEKGVENYGTKIKYSGVKTYSSYSKKQNSTIKSFINTIVTLGVNSSGVVSGGNYYDMPYKVKAQTNNGVYNVKISGKLSEVYGLNINGELVSTSDYTKTNSDITFNFDTKAQSLWVEEDEGEIYNEMWYLTAVGKDNVFTEQNVTFPIPSPDGETEGFLWDFSKNDKMTLTYQDQIGYDEFLYDHIYEKYNDKSSGVSCWDLSDWQSIKFNAYVPEEYGYTTFYFVFHSNDPKTSNPDYFGKEVRLYPGWNTVVINKEGMSSNYSPLGWDKITLIQLAPTGWGQSNVMNEKIYISNIEMYDAKLNLNQTLHSEKLQNAAIFADGGYSGIVNGKIYQSNPYDSETKVFKDGDIYYLPANVLAIANDPNATYYAGYKTLEFTLNGKKYEIKNGNKYKVDGESVALTYPAVQEGGAVYLSVDDMMTVFGYTEKYIDVMGLVALSNTKDLFDHDVDYNRLADLVSMCIYVRPTGDKIADDAMSYSGAKHPYIMMNQKDFDALNYYKKHDGTLKFYIETLEKTSGIGSENYNASPVNYHITDGLRLLDISNKAVARVIPWATLYKIYEYDRPEDAKLLAERIWAEMVAINQFQDWHPVHFLDTAGLAYPVAIAYDWLYDYWTDAQRGILEGMLYGFALKTTTSLGGSYNLASATNNWNGVCNGGIMAAALALVNVQNDVTWKANSTAVPEHGEIGFKVEELYDVDGGGADSVSLKQVTKYTTSAEDVRADIRKVLNDGILAIERGLWVYGPDGGYEEGPGYWSYGTTYTHIFIAALDKACGTNYGIYEAPGFSESVYFSTYLGSMNTAWGFHDGNSHAASVTIAPWFAKKTGDGNINAIRRQAIEAGWVGISYYDIIHFDPHIMEKEIALKKDALYTLDAMMTFRDSWDKDQSTFTGLHGGDNGASHGDLDTGNFVICVDGTYMICDLGSDDYNVDGYFQSTRWCYYRKRAEGQNTLVMRPAGTSWNGTTGDPSKGKNPIEDQKLDSVSKVIRYETNDSSAIGVIEMAPAYYQYMTEGIRGMYFTDDRSTIVVQDEASFNQSMDVWWFAHTEGEITVLEGGKTAVINRNGICLYAELVTDVEGASFSVMAAESLDKNYKGDTTPHPTYSGYKEYNRTSLSKLCVTAKGVTEIKWAVVFKVITTADEAPEFGTTYALTDIKDWKLD